ncbi:hypothetical protein ILYODFUR_011128 [Ilyodon furcidens]|uniref:Inward rectifier potassium channel C-terminal domain-containing protein n=1 Tax=Ilyodon furcidens TaxID=33524 RepID=A0ABV0SK96_9TELE
MFIDSRLGVLVKQGRAQSQDIGMMCQAKTSYIETETEWGARFEPCMTLEKGSFRVDLRRFHTTYKVPLPNCSASQANQLMVLGGCKVPSHKSCRDWEAWAEGTAVEDKDKSPSHIRFTIGDIQEERMSESNESKASAEQVMQQNLMRDF